MISKNFLKFKQDTSDFVVIFIMKLKTKIYQSTYKCIDYFAVC